jgi:hypothetical protein
MKYAILLAVLLGFCAAPDALHAQAPSSPLVTLSIGSQKALLEQASRLVRTVEPDQADSLRSEFAKMLGTPELAGIDAERPWQFALWFKGMESEPIMASYIPVTDFNVFKSGLTANGLLADAGRGNAILSSGSFAIVVHGDTSRTKLAPDDMAAVQKWVDSVPKSEAHTVHLKLELVDSIREQALGMLAMGRMMLLGSVPASAPGESGLNPAAMTAMLGLYIDMIEGAIKGLDQLEVEMDVTQDHMNLFKSVSAVPGSDLAGWLRPGGRSLSSLGGFLDPNAAVAFASRLQAGPGAVDFLKKASRLGFEMQNQTIDEQSLRRADELFAVLLPMNVAGSVWLDGGYRASGVGEIPGDQPAVTYSQILDWLEGIMKSQVGPEKIYSRFDLQRGIRNIGEVPVDRLTLMLNLEAPALKAAPQQRDVLESMWPGGKMEVEYALSGNSLHMAAGIPMEQAIVPRSGSTWLSMDPQTVLVGHYNLVALLKGNGASMRFLPPDLLGKFKKLDPTGSTAPFRVNVDGGLKAETRIPLRVLSTLSQLQ